MEILYRSYCFLHDLQEKVPKLIFRDLDNINIHDLKKRAYFPIIVIVTIIQDIPPHVLINLNSSHHLFQLHLSDVSISILHKRLKFYEIYNTISNVWNAYAILSLDNACFYSEAAIMNSKKSISPDMLMSTFAMMFRASCLAFSLSL